MQFQGTIANVTSKPNSKFPEVVDVQVKLAFSVDRTLVNLDRLNSMMGQEVEVRVNRIGSGV